MQPAIHKPNLGKLLPVGEDFVTVTKRMTKSRDCQRMNADCSGPLITYEVLRPGMIRTFTKGKRTYVCKVIALVELKTGLHYYQHKAQETGPDYFNPWQFTRWWQFSYLVRIIEN